MRPPAGRFLEWNSDSEHSSSKDSYPHLRKALCPPGFPLVQPSLLASPDAKGFTPWEPRWSSNSTFFLMLTARWGLLLIVLPFPVCVLLKRSCFCRFPMICVLSSAWFTRHTPHLHSPAISSVWLVCLEVGSGHQPWNVEKDDTNESEWTCVGHNKLEFTQEERGTHRSPMRRKKKAKEDEMGFCYCFVCGLNPCTVG